VRAGLNLVFHGDRAGGTGTYVRELVRALVALPDAPRLTLFVSRAAPPELRQADWAGEVDWVTLPWGPESRLNLPEVMAALPALAARRRLDVLHSPANVGPLASPGVARVVTLLDLIWLHQPEDWNASRWTRFTTRTLSLHSARRADRVLAISHAAAADFPRSAGIDPARIDVAPLGVRMPDPATAVTSEADLRAKLGVGAAPIVLSVAQKRPYKRLDTLIRALSELAGVPVLVLAGPPGDDEPRLRALAGELGLADRVAFVDWIAEADLAGLYRCAACFALPSEIEGFGLPVLEAMSHGTPVACSDRWSLPEVAGDAALLFDPDDQEAVTGALGRLLEDRELATRLGAAGVERARGFTWERTARGTLAAYGRAIDAG
jgi:glycosyltransferase involved in cell wall biosynthesis